MQRGIERGRSQGREKERQREEGENVVFRQHHRRRARLGRRQPFATNQSCHDVGVCCTVLLCSGSNCGPLSLAARGHSTGDVEGVERMGMRGMRGIRRMRARGKHSLPLTSMLSETPMGMLKFAMTFSIMLFASWSLRPSPVNAAMPSALMNPDDSSLARRPGMSILWNPDILELFDELIARRPRPTFLATARASISKDKLLESKIGLASLHRPGLVMIWLELIARQK